MLLKSRFYLPPLNAAHVARTSLIQQLETLPGGKIALICAPAGYGKSTLASQWLHQHHQTFCWLSLGEEHNRPAIFWRYALTAIQQALPNVGSEAEKLVVNSASAVAVVISLLNDLDELTVMNHSEDAVSIVLDDFHHLNHPELLKAINLFFDHLPANVRVVLTSRIEPDIYLAKRRANHQLLELNQAQITFNKKEAESLIRLQLEAPIDSQEVSEIYQYTEGWPTGLQLLLLQKKRMGTVEATKWLVKSDSFLDRTISDYLFDEVFVSLTKETQHFLMVTARANRFTAGLCNHVFKRRDSYQVIDQLEKLSLFVIPLDNHRTWYRYHDLFRSFLQETGSREMGDELASYVESSIEWLENNGCLIDAIEMSLGHDVWDKSMELIPQIIKEGEPEQKARVADWLLQLPVSMRDSLNDSLDSVDIPTSDDFTGYVLPDAFQTIADPLTNREQQVLELIAQGKSNQQIADQLFISVNTLKVHVRNLYGKIGVENRREAMLKVTQPSL
ncbi:LuxR C-terminal-related transcriptional regulator [Litoribacillus peritrichatus]|uniref:HTH luxR-type domain-containing protein n=1 Tax=Litoribacillus peritrichatus TaxID=718191 RepID=A0ABP7MF65_9GAMM